MEIIFYCLERKSIEDILPGLLERTIERGWRAVVRTDSTERMNALDNHLWTYSEESFLAHGTEATGHPSLQPVYLTTGDENPNSSSVLFLAGSEVPSHWNVPRLAGYSRVVVLFNGQDTDLLAAARASWREAQACGHQTAFWRQNPAGKWEQQKSD
ncbi:MAG TPA: DNA polymerase III subunit chi [Micropepsaceae bacterium]|nr:DNA polymerase III subunit chi [Micropepsaceae bacterium]